MIRVYENFTNDFLYPDINNMLVFASNHDTQRLYTIFDGDVNKYKLAMTLIATIRGIHRSIMVMKLGCRVIRP